MKATQMSISRGVGNEDVVHICDGISFSRKKEQKWVICRDVDKSRVCHTQWSRSEGEKERPHVNAYMWNLEKWSWWTYLQGRDRDADVENGHVDMGGACETSEMY